VKSRTRRINAVPRHLESRGSASAGCRSIFLPGNVSATISEELKPSLMPLLETIAHLNHQVCAFDRAIEMATYRYPKRCGFAK
jgi:hypothetical protein